MSELRLEWIQQHVADPKIIIDVGAFEGRTSKSLKQLYPFCRVIATEACNENFSILKHHCGGASGIEIYQYAFCDHSGEIQYWGSYSDRGDACHGSLHRPNYKMAEAFPHVKFREPVNVPAMTVEGLCRQMQLPQVDVLLIRMWGAEGDILLGLGSIRPKLIFFDLLPDDYYDGSMPEVKVQEMMRSLGYFLKWHGSHGAVYVLEKEQAVNISPYRDAVTPSVPLLSILTPSIPSRLPVLATLIQKLECQIGNLPIEHLVLIDNKKRSIGLKRDALVQSCRGSFCAFVDDDDDISLNHCLELVAAIREHPNVDTIVFNQTCLLGESNPFTVRFGLEYDNQQARIDKETGLYVDITRKPFPCCAWRTSLAKKHKFDDSGWDEDHKWCEKLWAEARTQHRIEKSLHIYRFNSKTSEGPQTIADQKRKGL